MFLHALAERLIIFQKDGVSVFEGGYDRFLEKIGWEDELEEQKPIKEKNSKVQKKDIRRKRSQIITERSKVIKPLERSIAKAEEAIVYNEELIKQLNIDMERASSTGNGKRIVEISMSMHKSEKEIERLFDELEKLTNKLNEQQKIFDEKLEEV